MTATDQPTSPAQAEHYLEQAYDLEEQGKLEQALQQCELAIQTTAHLAEAYNLKGIILEQLDRGEQAIAAYSKAVQLAPDLDEAQQNLLEARALQLNIQQKRVWKTMLWGRWGMEPA